MDAIPEEPGFDIDHLPVVALREILKKTDQQDIFNFRLVCVKWNEIIEDTSQLMKYI